MEIDFSTICMDLSHVHVCIPILIHTCMTFRYAPDIAKASLSSAKTLNIIHSLLLKFVYSMVIYIRNSEKSTSKSNKW